MRSARRFVFCAAVAISVVSSTACIVHAQPTAEDHDRARGLLADGRSKRAAGDHAAALESFQAAHKIEKLSTTGVEVGRTLVALGRLVEARELLWEIAKAPANTGEPSPLAAARADARELVDTLERRIPTLAVKLEGTADATVTATIDGIPVAVDLLGQPRRLDPGAHLIVIRKGTGHEEVSVALEEFKARLVTLNVPRDPNQEAAPPGVVKTPVRDDGTDPSQRSYVIAWVAGAVALVGIAVGSTTGGMAASRTPDLQRRCPGDQCPPDVHADLRAADALALTSTISFAVAAAAVGVVVWDLVRSPSTSAKTSLHVGVGSLGILSSF